MDEQKTLCSKANDFMDAARSKGLIATPETREREGMTTVAVTVGYAVPEGQTGERLVVVWHKAGHKGARWGLVRIVRRHARGQVGVKSLRAAYEYMDVMAAEVRRIAEERAEREAVASRPDVTKLFAPGERVLVAPQAWDQFNRVYVAQSGFVGTVVGYSRNGSYRVREPQYGTARDYSATGTVVELFKLAEAEPGGAPEEGPERYTVTEEFTAGQSVVWTARAGRVVAVRVTVPREFGMWDSDVLRAKLAEHAGVAVADVRAVREKSGRVAPRVWEVVRPPVEAVSVGEGLPSGEEFAHAVRTAHYAADVMRQVVKPEAWCGHVIVRRRDGGFSVFAERAWERPAVSGVLPWSAPEGERVAVVALDGSVSAWEAVSAPVAAVEPVEASTEPVTLVEPLGGPWEAVGMPGYAVGVMTVVMGLLDDRASRYRRVVLTVEGKGREGARDTMPTDAVWEYLCGEVADGGRLERCSEGEGWGLRLTRADGARLLLGPVAD
ncbi:hypothetical protein [Streptomyces sp. NPDC088752]|uniref:hypothetical protein n=1 Tax=Streptomyces sp. NPDC088752 TaxID=3154963 RepID=UPI00343ABBF5